MYISVAAFCYLTAAAAFLFLAGLLLTARRRNRYTAALLVPCVLTAIWAAAVAYYAALGHYFSPLTDILGILRNAAWSLFAVAILAPLLPWKTVFGIRIKPYIAVVTGAYAAFLLVTLIGHGYSAPAGDAAFMTNIVARLMLAILGILLIEQLYRNTPPGERWGIKLACLGIGGMFAYDFYLYSDAVLFRNMNWDLWAARGLADALTAPMIALSLARTPQWSIGIHVSRRFIFHSMTLFSCAVYLLSMAAAGYYLRYVGGTWGAPMQAAFLFGSVVLLASVLFSGSVRSMLKVYISRNFFSYTYDYREEWSRFTRLLSESGAELGERTVQALAELVQSPGGTLCLKRGDNYCEPAAHWNMTLVQSTEALAGAFCRFLRENDRIVDLHQFRVSPEKYPGLVLPRWAGAGSPARFVIPLMLQDELRGFVVLADSRIPVKLNWEISDLLKIAGRQAASHIAQHETDEALLVARQFEAFNRMSAFVVHDLKNLISQLSLVLSNVEKHKDNAEFQGDMLDTVEHSVGKMKRLLEKLGNGDDAEAAMPVMVDELLQHAVASKAACRPRPRLELEEKHVAVLAQGNRLERILGNLIQNAIEATSGDGHVLVRLSTTDGCALIELTDTGDGMTEEFIRDRLGKAFVTTKAAGTGIGVFESRDYIRELGGQMKVSSCPNAGTTFQVLLPLLEVTSPASRELA